MTAPKGFPDTYGMVDLGFTEHEAQRHYAFEWRQMLWRLHYDHKVPIARLAERYGKSRSRMRQIVDHADREIRRRPHYRGPAFPFMKGVADILEGKKLARQLPGIQFTITGRD